MIAALLQKQFVYRAGLMCMVASGLALSACLPSKGPVQFHGTAPKANAWDKVVFEHTRRDTLNYFHHRTADVRATLVTPRFRQAFLLERQRLHGAMADEFANDLINLGSPPDEGMDAPDKSRPNAEEQITFYVSLYTHDKRYRDLAAHDTIWQLYLEKGNTRVKPESISTLRFSPGLKEILPHADRFDDHYIVRFPFVDSETGTAFFAPDQKPLTLFIGSAMGESRLSWTLKGLAAVETKTKGE